MKRTDVKFFKSFLVQQKQSLLNKSYEFKNEQSTREDSYSDEAEVASRDISTNVSIVLHERTRATLFQIERALSRLEEGSFDLCELCGEEISLNRLKARPFTNTCLDCQEDQEDTRQRLN